MSLASVALLLIPPVSGLLVGYATGGRLTHISVIRFRWLGLVFLAASLQAAQYYDRPVRNFLENRLGVPILALVFALMAIWLVANLTRWPAPIRLAGICIALGAGLNGLAILMNGRMPYSVAAAELAGLKPGLTTPKNMPAGSGTALKFLGDTLPVSPLHKVVSPGDLLITLGGACLIALAMRSSCHLAEATSAEGGEQ